MRNQLTTMLKIGAFGVLLIVMVVLAAEVGNTAPGVLEQANATIAPESNVCFSECAFGR